MWKLVLFWFFEDCGFGSIGDGKFSVDIDIISNGKGEVFLGGIMKSGIKNLFIGVGLVV